MRDQFDGVLDGEPLVAAQWCRPAGTTAKGHAGQLFWAMIPTAAPSALQQAIWGEAPPPAWGVPRPLPEQIRAMTYLALATELIGELLLEGTRDARGPFAPALRAGAAS